jgi:hypothetical protein
MILFVLLALPHQTRISKERFISARVFDRPLNGRLVNKKGSGAEEKSFSGTFSFPVLSYDAQELGTRKDLRRRA